MKYIILICVVYPLLTIYFGLCVLIQRSLKDQDLLTGDFVFIFGVPLFLIALSFGEDYLKRKNKRGV